jgi:hypothetical protein
VVKRTDFFRGDELHIPLQPGSQVRKQNFFFGAGVGGWGAVPEAVYNLRLILKIVIKITL